jgi:flavin reductase (DIM6/NTAB) family NADH-FMN oxidoreductase RutF
VDETSFRAAMGGFASGVCVIAVRDSEGHPAGFTATSVASVSLDPPLLLFCLARDAPVTTAFKKSASFAVSVLASDQEAASAAFAADPHAGFDVHPWSPGASGAPLLNDRVAGLDCDVERIDDGGDHLIFVGRVRAVDCNAANAPLLRFRGSYRQLEQKP